MTLDQIDQFCRTLPACEVRYPFESNPKIRAWCLHRKMFAWTVTEQQPPMIQLKADPDLVPTLISAYESVLPGYHMNKRHWITVNASTCEPEMLLGLLEDAHNLIAISLPKAVRIGFQSD